MIFRSILSFVISYCLVMSPLHAQNAVQQEMLKQLIKESGLGKDMTVAEWLKKNRAYQHPKVAELASQWALKNPKMKMPKIEMSTLPAKNGAETTRLILKENGQSTVVDIVNQGENVYFQIEGKKYTYDDIYYDGYLENSTNSVQVTFNELQRASKLNSKKAAAYQANLRNLVNSLTALQQSVNDRAKKTSFIDLWIEEAFAAKNGDKCIMAGYSTVVAKGSCGGADTSLREGCPANNVRCNPNVYGASKEGSINCVPRAPATEVSPNCDAIYPIPGKEKELLESVIAHTASQSLEARNEFFVKLESDIQSASQICLGSNFDFDGLKRIVKADGQSKMFAEDNPLITAKFPAASERHHRIACATVMNRLFYMGDSQACVRESLAHQDAGEAQPKADSPECRRAIAAVTSPVADTGEIKTEPLPAEEIKTLPPVVVKGEKPEKKKNNALWWILGGLGVFALCKLWLCKDSKKPTPTLPPKPVGKPGETEKPRTGSGGVTGGVTGGYITPTTTGGSTGSTGTGSTGAVQPRGGAK